MSEVHVTISDMTIIDLPKADVPPDLRERLRKRFAELEAEMWAEAFPPQPPQGVHHAPSCGCRGIMHRPGCYVWAV